MTGARPTAAMAAALGGIVTAALVAGYAGGGAVNGVEVLAGEVTVRNGELVLPARAAVGIGDGKSIQVTGLFPGGDVDVGRGPYTGTNLFAHFGAISGLYRQDGTTMGDDPRSRWLPNGAPTTLELTCDRMLWVREDGRVMSRAGPDGPCAPTPLWVRAGGETRISGLTRDGKTVPWTVTRFAWEPMLGVGVAGITAGALLGPGGMGMLLATPVALLGPDMGLPAAALMLLIASATLSGVALARTGWRRWTAVMLAIGALVDSGRMVYAHSVHDAVANGAVEGAVAATVDIGLLQRKVDTIVNRTRPILAKIPAKPPLVVVLGSSSSGGGTAGRFWPDVLRDTLAGPAVISLAEGGATTWHERRVLETLDIHPAACVLYMGQNDTTASMPGVTIAELARGQKAKAGTWIAPETMDESRENVAAIASRCTVTVAMAEYVIGRTEPLGKFAMMLQTIPGVHVIDPMPVLTSQPRALLMLDDVHPSPAGQDLLGQFVAEQLRPLLAP